MASDETIDQVETNRTDNKSEKEALDDLKKSVTVDTLHQDEAVKVLAAYTGEAIWTDVEEKRVVKKIDRRLLGLLVLTYGLQYYDKAMLSQAAIFGMRDDLQLSVGDRYSFSASIFYLGFILGSTPAILMAQKFPIERVASGIVFFWGVCMMATAGVKTWQGLYIQRFFLGVLEAGVSPMFMLIVSGFYKKNEQAMRMGVWYCATGYVTMFAPLINYGLGHVTGGILHPWQYMYLVGGSLTALWSIVILFQLPPDPIRMKGLSGRERYIAVARMRVNNAGVRNKHFKKEQAFEVLVDPRFWLTFSMAFLLMIANGPVSSFIPIFINEFGYDTLTSLLLTVPCGAVIGSVELIAPYIAYKYPRTRCWMIVVCQLGTVLAALLLWLLPRSSKGGLLFGVYILACFGGSYAVLMGIQTANTAGYTKKSVTASGLFLAYCLGNFVGPMLFKTVDAPTYGPGFLAVVITSTLAAVLAVVYRYLCIWENKKRDSSGQTESFENAYVDDLTDIRNSQFRYQV